MFAVTINNKYNDSLKVSRTLEDGELFQLGGAMSHQVLKISKEYSDIGTLIINDAGSYDQKYNNKHYGWHASIQWIDDEHGKEIQWDCLYNDLGNIHIYLTSDGVDVKTKGGEAIKK